MKTYEKYKDSGVEWIGQIPSHWDTIRLANVFRPVSIKNHPNEQNLSVYRDYGVIPRDSRDDNHNVVSDDTNGYKLVEVGDFVMNKMKCWMGSIGLSHYRGIVSPAYIVLKVNKPSVYPNFYHYLLRSPLYIPEYRRLSYGVREGQWDMRFEDFREIQGLLPPLPEQHQIVSFLDEKTSLIDDLIQKKEQKIGLLKEYRTSLINRVITKGLNPDCPMKDSGVEWIGEIPSHWDVTPIKFLVSSPITDGPHETPEFIDDGVPFLSVEGIVGDKIDFSKIRGFISQDLHVQYSKKCKPQRNDVLLVKSGSTTGKSTIVETDLDFNIWSPLCIIRSNTDKVIPRFTYLVCQSGYFRLLIELNWSYGTQPNIGMGVIENIRLVIPPLSEQEEIVSFLDEKTSGIDRTIQSEKNKIELLKEYRQSLISSVITGKIKVVN